jgi:hypothetical protein
MSSTQVVAAAGRGDAVHRFYDTSPREIHVAVNVAVIRPPENVPRSANLARFTRESAEGRLGFEPRTRESSPTERRLWMPLVAYQVPVMGKGSQACRSRSRQHAARLRDSGVAAHRPMLTWPMGLRSEATHGRDLISRRVTG